MPTTQTLTITPPRSGADFLAQVKDHIEALWDKSVLRASAVGGRAAAVTATVTPDFSAISAGASFIITFPFALAAGATLDVSSTGAKPVVRADGVRITTGDVQPGMALVSYDGTSYRVLTSAGVPKAGCIGASQITATRASRMAHPVGFEAAARVFGGAGSGTWRLWSRTPNKGLGFADSINCLIVRVR